MTPIGGIHHVLTRNWSRGVILKTEQSVESPPARAMMPDQAKPDRDRSCAPRQPLNLANDRPPPVQLQRLVIQPNQLDDGHILLVPSQLHYLQRVLRLRQGDRFIAMDGQGQAWVAVLAAKAHESQAETLEAITAHTELPIRVTLVAALPKGSGFDEVVRQATELGVDQILPVM